MPEVSRVHSTYPFGIGKGRIQKLHPQYVIGFIDGEGSFSVSIGKHRTLRRGLEVRPEFEIELRADDREILERIAVTIGVGRIYDCNYDRYGWYPHVKYKITSVKDLVQYLFPFLDEHKPQAKKGKMYDCFREIVTMVSQKQHLSDEGYEKIVMIRGKMRLLGKKAKTFGNREGAGKPLAPWCETAQTDLDTARQVRGAGST